MIAFVLERTQIIKPPEDKKVDQGARVDLKCEATYDKRLELQYLWRRDNAVIEVDPPTKKYQWRRDQNVLTIADITVDDAGIYTCEAYTPEPKFSKDTKSATVDIAGMSSTQPF